MADFVGYEHNICKRNWYDHADYGKYQYYSNVEERRLGVPPEESTQW